MNHADSALGKEMPLIKSPYTTKRFAQLLSVKEATIRSGYCKSGHYLGVCPRKCANGRLYWDATEVENLISGLGGK